MYMNNSFFFTDKPRVWDKIPNFFVKERVYNFLNENRLTNCFQYIEKPNVLLLKCWADNTLKNVKIEIEGDTYKNKYYSQVITI